ncbi:Y-family DNA polymerase [Salisediminibacterium selenitireducens]|uniref:DNA-directed DNA polymerase n=1 Tax=Bacillus selenitireducens (strain ATCC 700615 / DSM 15326 / MLS10) TaxID=439292 RepID=D6XUN8_BACIE|nr:DNA-directed DNA polymerase [Salisediminibacterium selenitireducens]ADH99524.1 DNA-directed DNA polymerase [[Bacillus] selenitireducens MLS10]
MDHTDFPVQTTFCIDMKSFYASIACRKHGLDPLKACVAVVGAEDFDGSIVLAASPEMKRRFQIKTGNRRFEIPKHPDIRIIDAEMMNYLDVSVAITALLRRYFAPKDIFVYSVDEVFISFTPVHRHWHSPEEAACYIQRKIMRETGVPSVIGIGDNMLLSKLCLDLSAKKTSSGIGRWRYEDVEEKLWPHAARDMWGIGSRTGKRLRHMGVRTVGDISRAGEERLIREFGPAIGSQLYWHSLGVDLTRLAPEAPKGDISISNGQILMRDYSYEDVKVIILEMSEEVGRRTRQTGLMGRTVGLSVGYGRETGGGFNRSVSLPSATNATTVLYRAALDLLDRHMLCDLPARQVTVSLGNLEPDRYVQLTLLDEERISEKERQLGYIMDCIREKHGSNALLRAVSLTEAGTARHRNELTGGHRR